MFIGGKSLADKAKIFALAGEWSDQVIVFTGKGVVDEHGCSDDRVDDLGEHDLVVAVTALLWPRRNEVSHAGECTTRATKCASHNRAFVIRMIAHRMEGNAGGDPF